LVAATGPPSSARVAAEGFFWECCASKDDEANGYGLVDLEERSLLALGNYETGVWARGLAKSEPRNWGLAGGLAKSEQRNWGLARARISRGLCWVGGGLGLGPPSSAGRRGWLRCRDQERLIFQKVRSSLRIAASIILRLWLSARFKAGAPNAGAHAAEQLGNE